MDEPYWQRRNHDLEETTPEKIAGYLAEQAAQGRDDYLQMAQEVMRMIPSYCPYDCSYCSED